MKPLSTAMAAHLRTSVTTLATCWKITRRDGVVLGFTDHDADITYNQVGYLAASGFTPSAVAGCDKPVSARSTMQRIFVESPMCLVLTVCCKRPEREVIGLSRALL